MADSRYAIWLTLAFLAGAILVNVQVIREAAAYQQGRQAYAAARHFEKRLLDVNEWFNGNDRPNQRAATAELEATLDRNRRRANTWALGFALLALLYLAATFRLEREHPQRITTAIIITALTCLVTGLLAPMLEIAAFQRDLSIPIKIKTGLFSLDLDYTQRFPGDMYFYYQSKSVVELIGLLLRQHNWIVGLSILLFSVIIPIGKNSLALYALRRRQLPAAPFPRWLLLHSGKWSMADVFVVAIFLGFLAFNNMQTGVQTESKVLTGLYFFLAYALLAIWGSARIDAWQTERSGKYHYGR